MKTISENDQNSNQHTLEANMDIYTKDEVCMTVYSELSIDSKPKKSTKMSVIYKLKVRMSKNSNQFIAREYVNIHTKYKVSMIMYVGRTANQ